jgi:hypothetical protein
MGIVQQTRSVAGSTLLLDEMGKQVRCVHKQADGARPGEWRRKRGERSDDLSERQT